MQKRSIQKLVSLFSLLTSFFILPTPISAATTWNDLETAPGDTMADVATIKSLEGLFSNVVGIAISLVGLVTFAMIITGGIKYLTSGGDPKNTEAAQATITQGIIGLVLAVASYFILQAISGFTGIPDLLNFSVGLSPELTQ